MNARNAALACLRVLSTGVGTQLAAAEPISAEDTKVLGAVVDQHFPSRPTQILVLEPTMPAAAPDSAPGVEPFSLRGSDSGPNVTFVTYEGGLTALAEDSRPLRVGGDVKAPVLVKRVEAVPTDEAVRARISGMLVLGSSSTQPATSPTRVLKPLPFGLNKPPSRPSSSGMRTTLHGEPVAILFNVVVQFHPAK